MVTFLHHDIRILCENTAVRKIFFFSEQRKNASGCVKALTVMLPVLDLDFLKKEICNPNCHFPVEKKGYK